MKKSELVAAIAHLNDDDEVDFAAYNSEYEYHSVQNATPKVNKFYSYEYDRGFTGRDVFILGDFDHRDIYGYVNEKQAGRIKFKEKLAKEKLPEGWTCNLNLDLISNGVDLEYAKLFRAHLCVSDDQLQYFTGGTKCVFNTLRDAVDHFRPAAIEAQRRRAKALAQELKELNKQLKK